MSRGAVLLLAITLLTGCTDGREVPVLEGEVPDFTLTSHRNERISTADVTGQVHLVDFFFTSCPTICPTMTENLVLIQRAFADEPRLSILSHTIDPERDTPAKLRAYAERYGIESPRWHLLTGDRAGIFELSRGYKVQAYGGDDDGNDLFHDGTFVLLDGQRRVRGYYNGLEDEDVRRLINDLKILLP